MRYEHKTTHTKQKERTGKSHKQIDLAEVKWPKFPFTGEFSSVFRQKKEAEGETLALGVNNTSSALKDGH